MLYRLLKIWVRLASYLFCRKIVVNDPARFRMRGPLLLAANHPNSFLDAILLAILFKQPVYSLARGDAFRKPFFARLLRGLHMLPVYRTSEGVENLGENYRTFEACRDIFRKGGIVLIFSEGLGENEWHLRPLKKGTARLANSAWEAGIDLQVLPVAFNYSSYSLFGKNVFLNFGNPLTRDEFREDHGHGKRHAGFNETLRGELERYVLEIAPSDAVRQRELLRIPVSVSQRLLLFLPALAGFVLHVPLYFPLRLFAKRTTRGTIHYDSVMAGLFAILYPFYAIGLSGAACRLSGSALGWLGLFVFPLTARAWIWLSRQTD